MMLFFIIKFFINCSGCINLNKYYVEKKVNEGVLNNHEKSLILYNDSICKNEQIKYSNFLDGSNMSVTNYNNLNIDTHNNENNFISNDDFCDYLNFLDNITWETSDKIIIENEDTNRNKNFNEYLKQINDSINNYINRYLSKNNASNYIRRLDKIVETINVIIPCETDYNEIFTIAIDNCFKHILDDLKLRYVNYELNNENYDVFSFELDSKIKGIQKFKKYCQLQENIKQEKNLHLREFIRFYRYAKVFPELLTLGYASTQVSSKKVAIYLHLIALFCEFNEENLNTFKVFVMFLIKKAFSYTLKHKLDVFYVLKFQETESEKRESLNFFIWEFNNKIRCRLRQRIYQCEDSVINLNEDEKIHYIIVLKLFLIQHLIYLKMKNVKNSVFEEFKAFMDGVLIDEDCSYSNYFNQFITMI